MHDYLTNETNTRVGQVRPLKDRVENLLRLAVQLVHLVENQQAVAHKNTIVRANQIKHVWLRIQNLTTVHNELKAWNGSCKLARADLHSGPRAGQKFLQPSLAVTLWNPQSLSQQWKDGMWATHIHTVDDHSLNTFQQSLETREDMTISMVVYVLSHFKFMLQSCMPDFKSKGWCSLPFKRLWSGRFFFTFSESLLWSSKAAFIWS